MNGREFNKLMATHGIKGEKTVEAMRLAPPIVWSDWPAPFATTSRKLLLLPSVTDPVVSV